MIFLSRKRGSPDPHLDWRVRAFFAGGVVGLVGIALESRILIWVAIGILAVGMGLKLLGRKEDEDEDEDGASSAPKTEANDMEENAPHEP